MATAVVFTMSLAGLGGGYLLFAFLVDTDIEGSLWKATLVQLCVAALAFAMSLLYQQRPPTPPTARPAKVASNFLQEMLAAATNRQFVLLLFIASIPFGVFIAVWSTLEEILLPFTPKYVNLPQRAGYIGAAMIGGGLIMSTIVSFLLDRFRIRHRGAWYAWSVRVLSVLTVAFMLGLHLVIRFELGLAAIVIFGVLAGGFAVAALPAAIECGVEMTFPVAESNSGGLLLGLGNVISTIFILVLTFVSRITTAFLAVTCSGFVILVLLVFFRPRYLRLDAEEGSSSSTSEVQQLLTN